MKCKVDLCTCHNVLLEQNFNIIYSLLKETSLLFDVGNSFLCPSSGMTRLITTRENFPCEIEMIVPFVFGLSR